MTERDLPEQRSAAQTWYAARRPHAFACSSSTISWMRSSGSPSARANSPTRDSPSNTVSSQIGSEQRLLQASRTAAGQSPRRGDDRLDLNGDARLAVAPGRDGERLGLGCDPACGSASPPNPRPPPARAIRDAPLDPTSRERRERRLRGAGVAAGELCRRRRTEPTLRAAGCSSLGIRGGGAGSPSPSGGRRVSRAAWSAPSPALRRAEPRRPREPSERGTRRSGVQGDGVHVGRRRERLRAVAQPLNACTAPAWVTSRESAPASWPLSGLVRRYLPPPSLSQRPGHTEAFEVAAAKRPSPLLGRSRVPIIGEELAGVQLHVDEASKRSTSVATCASGASSTSPRLQHDAARVAERTAAVMRRLVEVRHRGVDAELGPELVEHPMARQPMARRRASNLTRSLARPCSIRPPAPIRPSTRTSNRPRRMTSRCSTPPIIPHEIGELDAMRCRSGRTSTRQSGRTDAAERGFELRHPFADPLEVELEERRRATSGFGPRLSPSAVP